MTKTDIHIHSSFSDGHDAPRQIVEFALVKGFDRICVTDHVRSDSAWLDEFFSEIEAIKEEFAGCIEVLAGVEAKVSDLGGSIDADLARIEPADLVFAAFHRIPQAKGFMSSDQVRMRKTEALGNWSVALQAVLSNRAVDVIAHPGNILKMNGIRIPRYMKEEMASIAGRSGKLFEHNMSYRVPDEEFLSLLLAEGVRVLPGSDGHSISILDPLWRDWPSDESYDRQ